MVLWEATQHHCTCPLIQTWWKTVLYKRERGCGKTEYGATVSQLQAQNARTWTQASQYFEFEAQEGKFGCQHLWKINHHIWFSGMSLLELWSQHGSDWSLNSNLNSNNRSSACVHTIIGNLINGNGAMETSAPLSSPHALSSHSSKDMVHTLAHLSPVWWWGLLEPNLALRDAFQIIKEKSKYTNTIYWVRGSARYSVNACHTLYHSFHNNPLREIPNNSNSMVVETEAHIK